MISYDYTVNQTIQCGYIFFWPIMLPLLNRGNKMEEKKSLGAPLLSDLISLEPVASF